MPALYHFSENPDITVFVPRTPDHRPDVCPLVWTVDAEHAATRAGCSGLAFCLREDPRGTQSSAKAKGKT